MIARTVGTAMIAVAMAIATQSFADAKKPNVLVFFTDDVGWGDPGCYNPKSKIPTPNIDQLAKEGMRFTHAHSPAALCSPTRYSMLSGNYPFRGRLPAGTWGFNCKSQFRSGQEAVGTMLQKSGYHTAMFGKAGTGGYWQKKGAISEKTLAPDEWGFDYSYLLPKGHQSAPLAYFENGRQVANDTPWNAADVGERLLGKAIDFIDAHQRQHNGKPFFIHFCTDGAHSPYVPATTLAGLPLKGVTKMTDHTDMVHETDILLGALVKALDERGLRQNTLIVYTSDNGGIPYERDMGHDAVAGLRGKKGFILEGGHRVPFIASWPERIPAGSVRTQVIGTHDIVATALDLAGATVPESQCLDAVSLLPVLLDRRGDDQPVRTNLLVQSSPGRGPEDGAGFKANGPMGRLKDKGSKAPISFALFQGDWKLILSKNEPRALYDLKNDLGEERNLINDPAQAERISGMLAEYFAIRKSPRGTPPLKTGTWGNELR